MKIAKIGKIPNREKLVFTTILSPFIYLCITQDKNSYWEPIKNLFPSCDFTALMSRIKFLLTK